MSELHKQQIAVPIYIETLLSLLFISAMECKPQFCLVGSSLSSVHFLHRIGTVFILSGWAGSFFNIELLASKTQNKRPIVCTSLSSREGTIPKAQILREH